MKSRRALVCAPVPPEFDRESGSRRIFHLIEFLQEDGWAVSFLAKNVASGERHMQVLRQRGVAAYGAGDSHLDALVSYGGFDLAIVAFWHLASSYLPRIRALSPSTRVLVDSIDLHFIRQARNAFLQRPADGIQSGLSPAYAADMLGELNTYAASDGVLTVSHKEAELVNDFVGDREMAFEVPDCEETAPSSIPFAERKGVVFLGNFRHPPNVDAATHLCRDIVPLLDPAVTAEHPISIVGNGLDKVVTALGPVPPAVRLVGWVPDVVPYLASARVSILPLRYGAGTKRKLLQSLMIGTPSVTTSIGSEGIGLEHGKHVLVADNPDAFASSITALLDNEPLWQELALAGTAAVRVKHGRLAAKARFLAALDVAFARPPKQLSAADLLALSSHISGHDLQYQALVRQVREVVQTQLPHDGAVIVVSKGDNALVTFDGREGWHFPQSADGTYAGYYPAHSDDAIAQLEKLRASGGKFLLFPGPSQWWLEHYSEFRKHLETHYTVLIKDDNCAIYSLSMPQTEPAETDGGMEG